MEELIGKVKSSVALSAEAENHLRSITKEKLAPKGAVLIRQGEAVSKVYFVTSGCLRSYCIDSNGKEHTLQFAIKDWWISDFIAVYGDQAATLTIECLSESNLIEFKAKDLDEILRLFPEIEPFQRGNLERHIVALQKRILNQLQLTASQRYDLFLKQYPDIEQHTRNYHIASFLGITKESLSRLRSDIAGN